MQALGRMDGAPPLSAQIAEAEGGRRRALAPRRRRARGGPGGPCRLLRAGQSAHPRADHPGRRIGGHPRRRNGARSGRSERRAGPRGPRMCRSRNSRGFRLKPPRSGADYATGPARYRFRPSSPSQVEASTVSGPFLCPDRPAAPRRRTATTGAARRSAAPRRRPSATAAASRRGSSRPARRRVADAVDVGRAERERLARARPCARPARRRARAAPRATAPAATATAPADRSWSWKPVSWSSIQQISQTATCSSRCSSA